MSTALIYPSCTGSGGATLTNCAVGSSTLTIVGAGFYSSVSVTVSGGVPALTCSGTLIMNATMLSCTLSVLYWW